MIRFALVVALAASAVTAVTAVTAAPASAAPGDLTYTSEPSGTWTVTGGQVYAMVRVGDKLAIGGSFTGLRSPSGVTTARSRLALIDPATGAPTSGWAPAADGTVRALATDGTRLFVGGSFATISGAARARLAAVTAASGAVDGNFRADANNDVRSLLLANGKLYLGGLFTTLKGVNRVRAAAVSPTTGSVDGVWKPVASWAVNSMVTVPGTNWIALGGEFSTISGQARRYLAQVDRSSAAVRAWAPAPDCVNADNPCIVRSVVASAGTVYAAVGGVGGRLSAYDAATGTRRWSQYGDGDVQVVALQGGTVYAGGHFDPLFGYQDGANQTRYSVAAADVSTGRLTGFAPMVTGGSGVWALLPEPDGLRIGGSFTAINGYTTRRGYGSFELDSFTVS